MTAELSQPVLPSQPPVITYRVYGWLFPRALALIYLIAFLSWAWQADALTGEKGILPVPQFLESAKNYAETQSLSVWANFPTLYWFGFSDAMAQWLCLGSCIAAGLVMLGLLQGPLLLVLWFAYLSICTTSGVFMGYQWDALLLEAGFIAALISPWRLFAGRIHERLPHPTGIQALLPQMLVIKLMLLSGIVKITAGDPNWHNLTALRYHYETQPIPTWVAWHVHQLPLWFHQASCFLMFVVELVLPILLALALVLELMLPRVRRMTRVVKQIVAAAFTGLMVVTLLTGNYTYFNWLTILLSLSVLDDACWPGFARRALRWSPAPLSPGSWPRTLKHVLASVMLCLSLMTSVQDNVTLPKTLEDGFAATLKPIAPFRSINSYGLFRVMTTERNEIIIEVSDDGVYFQPIEFKWKPGQPDRAPPFVAPHQPRLDWQMWFAAFNPGFLPQRDGQSPHMAWFGSFLGTLLEHRAGVYALMEPPPFPVEQIRAVRAKFVNYKFTDAETRRKTGEWWVTTPLGDYSPTFRLR